MNNWNSNNLISLELSRVNRPIKYLINNIKIPQISVFFSAVIYSTSRLPQHSVLLWDERYLAAHVGAINM